MDDRTEIAFLWRQMRRWRPFVQAAGRLGQQRCPATCRLHKGADGAWSPPAGWGARDRYGWYCPARTP